MKTLLKSFAIILMFMLTISCNLFKKKTEDIAPIDTTPEYEKAIDAKFKALGWDKDGHTKYNGSGPVQTAAKKGFVQYYAFGDRKTAIYYSDKGAFAMDTEEMKAYDAAWSGQLGIGGF